MIEINLIPDVKLELIKARHTKAKVVSMAIVIGIIAVGVVVALAIYAFGIQTIRGAVDDNNIKTQYAKLSKVKDLSKVLTIQNQLSQISTLNDSKKIYSRLFDMLNAICPSSPNDIQISTLSIDGNEQSVTIEGQAENSYAALDVFKKTLGNTKVKYTDANGEKQTVDLASNIVTSDTSYGEDSSGNKVLRFTLTFNYSEEAFASTSSNVSMYVSGTGNVTDSYLGMPTSLFTTRATDLTEGQ